MPEFRYNNIMKCIPILKILLLIVLMVHCLIQSVKAYSILTIPELIPPIPSGRSLRVIEPPRRAKVCSANVMMAKIVDGKCLSCSLSQKEFEMLRKIAMLMKPEEFEKFQDQAFTTSKTEFIASISMKLLDKDIMLASSSQ